MNRSAEDGEWSSPHYGGEGTGVPPRRTKVCAGDTVGKSVSNPGRPGIVHREGMAGIVRHSQTKGRETGNAKPGLKPPMVGADISASEIPTEAVPGVGSGRGTQERGQSKRPRIAAGRAATPVSGRIEARTGLRMMPTFPRSPLSFRTAGFPPYGLKGWLSGGGLPGGNG